KEEHTTKQIKTGPTKEHEHREKEGDAVRLIAFENGSKLLIEFFYDCDGIVLGDCKLVENVNDLVFFFTRHQTESNDAFPTVFNVTLGDLTINMFDSNKDCARFRIGPFLAHHLADRSIAYQSIRRPSETPEYTMKVHISYSKKDYLTTLSEDRSELANNVRTRGINVSMEPVNVLIPSELENVLVPSEPENVSIPTELVNVPILTEVAGLFSMYFYNIFFGGYTERNKQWVEVKLEMDVETIREIIVASAHRYNCALKLRDFNNAASILEHCDRF
ncbi:hypothetical protein PMAYCL1PPCAC_13402, partial [Pristionchus mayeri]